MVETKFPKNIRVSEKTHTAIDERIGHNGCRYVDDVIQWLLKNQKK